jgi:hypothetical protein
MRAGLAALVAAVAVAAGTVGAGCVIITGSTDGYRAPDAGGDGAADGGPAVSFECVYAADCGDGGKVCCMVVNSSLTTVNTTCQAAPCSAGSLPAQWCSTSSECEASPCTCQECPLGSASVIIQACGTVSSFCTPRSCTP